MRQSASPGRNVVHCTRARVRTYLPNLSLRTSAHTGAAIRVPAGKPGKLALLQANPQHLSYSPEVLLSVMSYRREYGLPRRFAPRNDMQKEGRVRRCKDVGREGVQKAGACAQVQGGVARKVCRTLPRIWGCKVVFHSPCTRSPIMVHPTILPAKPGKTALTNRGRCTRISP